MKEKLKIIVLGHVVRWPIGGMVWSNLQYIMGLRKLGHDVYYIEDSDNYASCYNVNLDITTADPKYGLSFAKHVFGSIGHTERWGYYDWHSKEWFGPLERTAIHHCNSADVVLNVACVNPLREWLQEVPCRVYIDEDPCFNQVKILRDKEARDRACQHNAFFSFGANIGLPECEVPQDGLNWMPTRHPIFLDRYSVVQNSDNQKFTTVMQWESYEPVDYCGRRFGLKSSSFGQFAELPRRTKQKFEIVMGGETAPRKRLEGLGWQFADPLRVSKSPATYEAFIRRSRAEIGIVKEGYVASRCGWFSERSACYLASGRPVMHQDTGFGEWLDAGKGVLAFADMEDAVSAVEDINRCYKQHSVAAREIVSEYFDSKKVLAKLIDEAFAQIISSPL